MKTLPTNLKIVMVAVVLLYASVVARVISTNSDLIYALAYVVFVPKIDIEPIEVVEEIIEITQYEQFLEDLGFKESSNNYNAINRFGYLGKYQFGRATLNNLGYDNISNREFLSNPSLQDKAMEDLLLHNAEILRSYIEKYDGKLIHGVYVTKSGILAAAHLAGPTHVKKWFNTGKDFKDGMGTKLTSYLKNFGGYELGL